MSSVVSKQRSGDGVSAPDDDVRHGDVRLGALFDQACASLHLAVDVLEPECLSGGDAKVLYGAVVEVLRVATAAKLALATRIDSSGIWKESGHRNAATLIAETEGVGVGHARATLETGKALVDAPKTAEALREGKLSEDQVKELAGAVAVDPAQESVLVDAARGGEPMPVFKDRCRKTRARAASADPDKTMARIHADRHLRWWTDPEGAFCLSGRFTPDRGAQLAAVLDRATNDRFEAARTEGGRESFAAYRADAFVDLVCGDSPQRGRPKTVVNIRVDHEALMNGRARGSEVSTIDGIGEVPIRTIESLLPDSFLKVLFYQSEELTRISHPGRTLKEKLKTALDDQYPTCVVPGCGSSKFLETDHIKTFRDNGPTEFNNLVHLCSFHHGLKTNAGYEVYRDDAGAWHFDPPPPFGQEPDLGGEPGGGLYDPELHLASRRTAATVNGSNGSTTKNGSTAGAVGSGLGADPPDRPAGNAGRKRPAGRGSASKPGNDADPGQSPPRFKLGE